MATRTIELSICDWCGFEVETDRDFTGKPPRRWREKGSDLLCEDCCEKYDAAIEKARADAPSMTPTNRNTTPPSGDGNARD